MYHAKERGRNTFERYTPEMHSRANEQLLIESNLRRALERNEFLLHYQPLLDLRSGRVVGAEALVRWGAIRSWVWSRLRASSRWPKKPA
ncbi:EAL domain-containing protein [Noviherbaspirillum autotrophicum]|uniref:EAL domain-containing protein n=1 Tax=Noviherbaspirillum autotrophicum TaxID=709839 RepID=UPI000693385D|nr:EAL domain-containing protein [Noviherbaspirillum autotrophicum]